MSESVKKPRKQYDENFKRCRRLNTGTTRASHGKQVALELGINHWMLRGKALRFAQGTKLAVANTKAELQRTKQAVAAGVRNVVREQRDILKKLLGASSPASLSWDHSYQLIKQLAGEHSVQALCWDAAGQPRRLLPLVALSPPVIGHRKMHSSTALLQREHQQSRLTYGRPRLQARLRSLGHRHKWQAHCPVDEGCSALWAITAAAVHSMHHPKQPFRPIAPNLLARRKAPTTTDEVLITDLTYAQTAEGWLYVSAIPGPLQSVCGRLGLRIKSGCHVASGGFAHGCATPKTSQWTGASFGSWLPIRQQPIPRATPPPRPASQHMSRAANCYDNAASGIILEHT